MINRIIHFFLYNRLITVLLVGMLLVWGLVTAPFAWETNLPSDPVPVDAIPDIGENQQIVFTNWPGRSPQDIEDQITYPLTSALLGVPGVKSIRSNSIFGLSTIYVVFNDDVEFYWSRTRILEKLNSLPPGQLPDGVKPSLGPDATALGQVYWYTLEGRNPKTGEPTGGWDPQELRTIQDYYIRYYLSTADGVSEVASIGGFVKEYQVDLDPLVLSQYNITLEQVMNAIQESNQDVGARTLEFNRAEYLIRGLGYIKSIEDIENTVIVSRNNTPVRIKDVARVNLGPANRRGGLDKEGAEATGAVVVARYGSNPMQVIDNIKSKIEEINPGLPSRTLADGTVSKVTIVPFYDRSGLIHETIGTLEHALTHEILITIMVVLVLVMNIRASIVISGMLPIAVLITFVIMRYAGVDANVVALSGIAIAIGVMVDVGIVFVENIISHKELPENKGKKGKDLLKIIHDASVEVAPAIITALATTVISFLPVFFMEAGEGKLFRPLAFTKTFALLVTLALGLVMIPTATYLIYSAGNFKKWLQKVISVLLVVGGIVIIALTGKWIALALTLVGALRILKNFVPYINQHSNAIYIGILLVSVAWILTYTWMPLGVSVSLVINMLFVLIIIGMVLSGLYMVVKYYVPVLKWFLENKKVFYIIPFSLLLFGLLSWQGFSGIFGWTSKTGLLSEDSGLYQTMSKVFPPLGEEFMPALDEGSFLLMPTTMTHSGVEENIEVIRKLDMYVSQIPEVDLVVGKWGRVNSALDPAPISMFENTINYKTEYAVNEKGDRIRFAINDDGSYLLKDGTTYNPKEGFRMIPVNQLVPDEQGQYFRQWRDHIKSPDDIWDEIVASTRIPGLTSAPKLQPIQTRLVMLSTGMRAPMGIKVFGPDLATIEKTGLALEQILQEVPSIEPSTVFADRIVGKPYLEINIDRTAIARYGLSISDVQRFIEVAIGGKTMTTTVEGRERFNVRLRYARDFRSSPDELKEVLLNTKQGVKVPLGEVAEIQYRKGPQMIRSEDTFLTGYVIFDKVDNISEVEVVNQARDLINRKIESGEFSLPPGVTYKFTGNYENQIRASKRLAILIPLSLFLIFLILYFQFRSVTLSLLVYSGVFVAFAGGFIMIWLYGQEWFMNFSVVGTDLRDMFDMHTINMSVAVWVGFIALFGIATDDGVIMGTYIQQTFEKEKPKTVQEIREAIVVAGSKRVRPALMTAATAIIALIPVLSSTGKGSDIMVPMAIPTFGGMVIQLITMFVVPVTYSFIKERQLKK